MKYDRDIRRARRLSWMLICLNAGGALYEWKWYITVASGLWIINCLMWLNIMKAQQATRDYVRTIEAELHRQLEVGE